MAALSRTLLERTAEILNDDPFVKENTKRCKATLYLACENNKFALAFDNGKVRLLADGESGADPVVSISGNKENWNKIISGLPGGLHRAFRHKLLRFEGDATTMLTIWKTIWRLGEALANENKEGR